MPTVPRRPAGQAERDRLQARRLRAAELFAAGVRQAEVARQLGVSAQAVSVWHARWQASGAMACVAAVPSWPSRSRPATTTPAPDRGPRRAAPVPGWGEGHLVVGRAARHRSNAMRAWLNRKRSWLVTERLPAYAPELNPVEGVVVQPQGRGAGQPLCPTLAEAIAQAQLGIERVRRTPHLAYSFLRHAGLSVT
jgi:transposase-like protein